MQEIYSNNTNINSSQEYSFTFQCTTTEFNPVINIDLSVGSIGSTSSLVPFYADRVNGRLNPITLPSTLNESITGILYPYGYGPNAEESASSPK